jgi:hypothetical protein
MTPGCLTGWSATRALAGPEVTFLRVLIARVTGEIFLVWCNAGYRRFVTS